MLGLNFGTHDSAAALVIDGKIVAAAEEERFNREKHTKVFPIEAISFCLKRAGIRSQELGHVAFFVDPLLQLGLPLANLYYGFPWSAGALSSDLQKYWARRQAAGRLRDCGLFSREVRILPVRHHLAHAASSFLVSPFDQAVVVTIDGRGEYETACIFEGRGRRLTLRHSVIYPHSIGYFYSMLTRFLGFRPNRDEYKVMGLAASGGPGRFDGIVKEMVSVNGDTGRLRLNLLFFDHHRRPSATRQLFSDALVDQLGPQRRPGEPITDRHRDIAWALQRVTENVIMEYVRFAHKLVPSETLCLAGGVMLNALANAAVIESGAFERVFIQPAANDAGASLGAALVAQNIEDPLVQRNTLRDVFLGPEFTDDIIVDALAELPGETYRIKVLSDPGATASKLLAAGEVIGWFQGRMEFGPRALGARSILAPATNGANLGRINSLIKQRESFRPLAPAVLEEHVAEYFAIHAAGKAVYPFMLATAMVLPHKRTVIPAVVHVDGSARVQIVSRESNPALWSVINGYFALSGIPVVLNTSFNCAEEPIVCTPQDAVETFVKCGLDALVIGRHLVRHVEAGGGLFCA